MTTESSWMDDALCAEVGREFFFPEPGVGAWDAKSICASCPVAAQCLEYAQTNTFTYGVWGGLTPDERRRLRRAAA